MKAVRRIISLTAAAILAISPLAACSGDDTATDEATTQITEVTVDQSSPAATVTTLLNAWEAGRPDIVEQLIHPDETDDDAVIQTVDQAADATALATNGEIVNTEYTDDGAEVDYTYTVGDTEFDDTCELEQGGPDGADWYLVEYDEAYYEQDAVYDTIYDTATIGGMSALNTTIHLVPGVYHVESSFLWGSYSGEQVAGPDDITIDGNTYGEIDFNPVEGYDTDMIIQWAEQNVIPELEDVDDWTCENWAANSTWYGNDSHDNTLTDDNTDADTVLSACQTVTGGTRSQVTENFTIGNADVNKWGSPIITFATGQRRDAYVSDGEVTWIDQNAEGCSYMINVDAYSDYQGYYWWLTHATEDGQQDDFTVGLSDGFQYSGGCPILFDNTGSTVRVDF